MYELDVWQILAKGMNTHLETVIYFLKASTNLTSRDEDRDVKIREIARVESEPYTTYNT
jgi:hypothetical protein